ncbi:DUF6082 family protein [Micromonospora sp. NPDC003241]
MVTDVARRSMTPTVLLLAVLAILAAVLLSPAGLLWIGERPGYDWSLLGNVGEAYGAASAILAGLALMGVAISLIIQAREAKAAREQALRALHTDLLKMAIVPTSAAFHPDRGPELPGGRHCGSASRCDGRPIIVERSRGRS